MDVVTMFGISLALAFLCESMTEYLFGTLFDHLPKLAQYKWALFYVALAAGVGMSFYYQLDLIGLLINQTETPVGMLLTGLVIGRGASFVHQFISNYMPKAAAAQAEPEYAEPPQ